MPVGEFCLGHHADACYYAEAGRRAFPPEARRCNFASAQGPAGLLSRMRCRAKKRVREARGAADSGYVGKPSNVADTLFGSNPKGRERLAPQLANERVARPCSSPAIVVDSRLEPRSNRPRRMRNRKPDRRLVSLRFAGEPALQLVQRVAEIVRGRPHVAASLRVKRARVVDRVGHVALGIAEAVVS